MLPFADAICQTSVGAAAANSYVRREWARMLEAMRSETKAQVLHESKHLCGGIHAVVKVHHIFDDVLLAVRNVVDKP